MRLRRERLDRSHSISSRSPLHLVGHGVWIGGGVGVGHRVGARFVGIVRTGDRSAPGTRFVMGLFFVEVNFAVAAITAGTAFLTEMVGTGVLSATDADTVRLFFADAADEGHNVRHWVFRVERAGWAGWRERVARQRCASLSTTANSCS